MGWTCSPLGTYSALSLQISRQKKTKVFLFLLECRMLACKTRLILQMFTLCTASKFLQGVGVFVYLCLCERFTTISCGPQPSPPTHVRFYLHLCLPGRIPGNAYLRLYKEEHHSSLKPELHSKLQNTFLTSKAPSLKLWWRWLNIDNCSVYL